MDLQLEAKTRNLGIVLIYNKASSEIWFCATWGCIYWQPPAPTEKNFPAVSENVIWTIKRPFRLEPFVA